MRTIVLLGMAARVRGAASFSVGVRL